jgi:hypothetical protein
MPARPRAPLARIAILTAAAAAVVASQVIAPLTASALAPPPKPAQHHPAAPPTGVADPTPPTNQPLPWSAARARPHLAPQATANAAALRAQAIASAATTERTASYTVSSATLRFLHAGLGIPLGASTTFTGVRSGSSLTISLPAPERLRTAVPGARLPAFTHSLLTIDQRTGAATLTASVPTGSLKVTIPDVTSTTLAGLSGTVTARMRALGQTATLSGTLGYQAGAPVTVSLQGTLAAGADVKPGVVELKAGATVTAASAGGLRVAGPATLGPAGHQLAVTVAGPVTGANSWNLAVTAVSGSPLSGLALAPGASGSVTDAHGRVTYDVRGGTARPWAAAPGVTVSGAVEFSNDLPNRSLVPAPGLTGSGSWADVTGTVALASGVSTHGTAAINLGTGQGLLTSAGRTPVTLQTPKGTVIHDSAGFHGGLTVSPSGQVAATLPGQLSRWTPAAATSPGPTTHPAAPPKASAGPTARSAPTALVAGQSAATAGSTSYTLSGPVRDFITNALHIPLGSATVTGTLSGSTLTLAVGAPASLPSAVPSWLPNPSYVNTQVTIDEAANTVTLTAQTGTTSGLTATLSVAIANAATSDLSSGTDVTGSLTLGGVPFAGGATAGLTFTLGYTGGALSASLSGSLTSAATFANGVVTIPAGTSLTLATGSGITLNGAADLTYNGQTTEITVNGTLMSLSSWSLTVGNASGASWQPVTGLTITPNFSGSIADANGSISFDLSSGTGSATWVSPDQSSMVSVNSLELSNQAPGASAACKASDVTTGDLWIGIGGTFSYVPASLNLSATGCFDLTGKHATITTAATGNLTSEFGSTLPFTVTAAGLTAHIGGSYSLTGTATVTVTGGGVSGAPTFNVGLQLSSAGITAGIGGKDLGGLGFTGSGALYVSTVAVQDFDPATLGITGQQPATFNLPAGLSVSVSYTLPADIESKLQKLIPGLGNRTIPGLTPGTSLQSLATLSTSGFTVDLGVSLGATTNGLTIFNANNSALYLNRFDVKLALGAQNSLSLSGTGYLVLPPLAPGQGSSSVSITISGSFNITSLTISLGFNFGNWSPAFGVTGLSVQDFGGTFGLTLESGVPTPSLGIYADNIQLPASWNKAIGMVNGTSIWFNANLNLAQPVLGFKIYNPYGGPALTPLALASTDPTVINSFVVNTASFWLAPAGGSTPAGDTLNMGVSLVFDAALDNVPVHVDANVNLTAPSVTANASIGAFTIGPVQTSNTSFHLNLSPTSLGLGISGGVYYNNDSFTANVQFTVGSSMAGGSVSLSITGGLPWYFEGGATLNGSVYGDGSGARISASGSGWMYAAGSFLGPVSFSFSLPGSLSWSDVSNSITQVAQFFVSSGMNFDQIVAALKQFGYQTYDIVNALSQIGQYGPQIASALASAFGFSTTYFDIWTYTNSGQFLVMDVTGGSQSPNAGVETWTWNNGYNQDWAFVQSPYSGWYEIMNRGSGQCLSVGNNTSTPGNPLVQWPCAGAWNQLWYMGGISLSTNYYIESALDGEYADVAGAYPWAGGTVDQWYYNGGQNQRFWLTNSGN